MMEITNSTSKENTDEKVYEFEVENEMNGRYDDFGNFIKNLEFMPELFDKLSKFHKEKKLSPTAIVLILLNEEKPSRDDAYAALKELKCNPDNVRGMYHRGMKGFNIDFYDISWKKHVISTVNKYYSDQYKVYACVEDDTKVTVSGIPAHFEDSELLEFLNIFGEFDSNLDNVVHRFDKNGADMGERIYSAKKIVVDIPSYWWLYGHQLNFRYAKQPHTCRLCGKRGHQATNCSHEENNDVSSSWTVNVESDLQTKEASGSNASASSTVSVSEPAPGGLISYAQMTGKNTVGTGNAKNNNQRGGSKLQRRWRDGGYTRPDGFRPEYLNQNERKRPGNATLADYFSKGGTNPMVKKLGNKRRVMVVARSKAQIENDKLIKDVNEKIEQVHRIVGDNAFMDGDGETIAKEVHQKMAEVKFLVDKEEYEPNVDGSPEAIKKLLEYDIELLTGCSQRIGASCGARLKAPMFQTMIQNFISGLKSRKRAADISSKSEEST